MKVCMFKTNQLLFVLKICKTFFILVPVLGQMGNLYSYKDCGLALALALAHQTLQMLT